MSTQVQIRRGNTAQTAAFTGAIAELTVDTDKRVVVVHDGTTAGGNPLIKANASITTGQILTSNGSHLLALSNTGTAGTYGNASFIPVVTTDAYGRVSSVTNTAIAISSGVVTGVMTFAQGGANATSYTTGGLLTSNGTAFVSVANTGTAGTYGNAAYHPVITTDAYGRVSGVTNTLVQIAASQVTSGVLPFAQGGSNNTTYTTGAILTSNGTAFVALANTGTAGTYANAAYIPVITTDAYGRVSAVTNTAVAIDTAAITSGTLADARLPATGTAGTYANSTFVPVITTDSKGRVTAITNTAIAFPVTSVAGVTGAVSNTQLLNGILTVDGSGSGLDADKLDGLESASFANAAFANTRFSSSGGSITGDVSVTGNLTIIGQTIYANTTTALIADNIITLNAAINQASAPTVDAGFEVDRGSSVNVSLLWNETSDKWTFTNDGTNYLNIADAGRLDSVFSLANGTAGVANTDFTTISATAGVYGNASHVTVTTLTANGRVSAITNTAIAIDTAQITSGTIADARLPTKGTAGVYGNAAYHPVITTDAYGRVTAVTNTLVQIAASQVTSGVLPFAQGGANNTTYTTGAILTSNGTAFVALSNTGTAGTYSNASHVPVITTDAYGRVSAVTNTAIAIDTAAITSGTLADARLPATGAAGTYANASHVPVITTDAKGRVTAVTNTAIVISAAAITSGTLAVAQGGTGVTTSTGTGSVVLNTAPTITSINVTNTTVSTSNTTGAITVAGGVGIKGNVYADAIYDGGVEVIVFAQAAFNQANSVYLPSVTRLDVTHSSSSAYLIDQYTGNNPELYIRAGETLAFNLAVTGHPFLIRVSSGGAQYNTGLTHVTTTGTVTTGSSAQGQVTGTLYWKVPAELAGNTYVYQCSIHGGMVGNIVIERPNQANSSALYANAAFDKANSANILAQNAYNHANGAFAAANASGQLSFTTVSANGTSLVADTSSDTLTITSAVANGIFITGTSGTDTIDIGLINSGVTATGYGDSVSIPTFVVDSKGRLTSVSNTSIRSGSTSQTGIILLQDSFISTSTSNAATANSVKNAYDFAQASYNFANTISTGAAIDNVARTTATAAFLQANAAFSAANSANVFDYTTVSATAGTYGNSTYYPIVTVSANGRVTNVSSQISASSGASIGDVLALAIALG